jgi:hypothetical protein
MDKKGDITITLLVIGVLMVCFFALFSFYNSTLTSEYNFKAVELVSKMNIRIEKGDFDDIKTDYIKGRLRKYIEEREKVTDIGWTVGRKTVVFVKYYLP